MKKNDKSPQKIQIANDFALLHFKQDIPCFQFSGFSKDDKAGEKELKKLLAAIIKLADSADVITRSLSDRYPAQHSIIPSKALKRGGIVRLPLDQRDPSLYITIWPDCIEVPFVWYNSGNTQVKWGRLESAVRETIRLISVPAS